MYSAVSNNIKISVVPEYDIKNSFPAENRFVFRYNITIENLGIDAVKLLKEDG
jgi:ApaG protein